MTEYKTLQNGSDIRAIAVEGVAGEHVNLTIEVANTIGRAFAKWLRETSGECDSNLSVAIGHDSRISGEKLLDACASGMLEEDIQVYDCGLASTPAMFMSTVFEETRCIGAVMVTASHLPYNRNGFKFFTSEGGLNKQDLKYMLTIAQSIEDSGEVAGVATLNKKPLDLMSLYSAHLRQIIIDGIGIADKPLDGIKIVVDASNGSGGFYANDVLKPLGADVSGSQFLDPDGMFPNHVPNPENKAAMDSISDRVLEFGADLGIIFDTDVDRSAAVDSSGREIARNDIVAMAAALIADEYPGATIVTDSVTSRQLKEFIENKLGMEHLRFKRGYKNVINKALDLNSEGIQCPLAIETSGHAAFKENYFLDDGAYLATKIVIKTASLALAGEKIDSVIADLEEPAEEKEIRIPVTADEFSCYGNKVIKLLEEKVEGSETDGISLESPNYEGVRINFPEGWCLLRKSLHEPLLPTNFAADTYGGCQVMINWLRHALSECEGLDLSVF